MTIDAMLAHLDGVKRSSKGWSARCPAHQDRSPSLSVREGERGILLHCFSGCSLDEICAALNLDLRELFYDHTKLGTPRAPVSPRPPTKRNVTKQLEDIFWSAATAWELRGLQILDAARNLDTTGWDAATFNRAMKAADRGYAALRVADHMDGLAFVLRCELLTFDADDNGGDRGRTRSAA